MSDPKKPAAGQGKSKPQNAPPPELFDVEKLGAGPEHAGACVAQGWLPGKMVTRDKYRAAVAAWREGRIDGQ